MARLEAELSSERRDRAAEAVLMGEMLVRVAEVESRYDSMERRAITLEESALAAGERLTQFSEQLDESRRESVQLRSEIDNLEAQLREAYADLHAASAAAAEASGRADGARARAASAIDRAEIAEDHARRLTTEAENEGEGGARFEARIAELERELAVTTANALDAALSHGAQMHEITATNDALSTQVTALTALVAEADQRAAGSEKSATESHETASLMTHELTKTERELDAMSARVASLDAEVGALRAALAQSVDERDSARARVAEGVREIAHARALLAQTAGEFDEKLAELGAARARDADAASRGHEALVAQIRALELQLSGARKALSDAERRHDESRQELQGALAAAAKANADLLALSERAMLAEAVVRELEEREAKVAKLRARTLERARELLAIPLFIGKARVAEGAAENAPAGLREGTDDGWDDIA